MTQENDYGRDIRFDCFVNLDMARTHLSRAITLLEEINNYVGMRFAPFEEDIDTTSLHEIFDKVMKMREKVDDTYNRNGEE